MKKLFAICLAFLLAFALVGCSSEKEVAIDVDTPKAEDDSGVSTENVSGDMDESQAATFINDPLDLTGTWEQSNSNSDTDYMSADISESVINVYWVSDSGDTKSLYWSGTFVAPTTTTEPYMWSSANDHAKTDSALLASSADTKDFSYQDGELGFSVSALGTTKTVRMVKTSDAVTDSPVPAESTAPTAPIASSVDEYVIGETWTVDGQWSLTVDSIEETQDRNDYEERKPAAVYIVTYTYTNIGYKDAIGLMDGLYFTMDETVVDNTGKMAYSYPGDVTYYPQETPIGATCTGQCCIGVENPGAIKIHVTQYDGNSNEQNAIFVVAP